MHNCASLKIYSSTVLDYLILYDKDWKFQGPGLQSKTKGFWLKPVFLIHIVRIIRLIWLFSRKKIAILPYLAIPWHRYHQPISLFLRVSMEDSCEFTIDNSEIDFRDFIINLGIVRGAYRKIPEECSVGWECGCWRYFRSTIVLDLVSVNT